MPVDPRARFSPTMLSAHCEIHNMPLSLPTDDGLCPIGRIEHATDEALARLEDATTDALASVLDAKG
jgi:hypothetical protein